MEVGNKSTVENQFFRVTIEHLDINGGNMEELFDLIKQCVLGNGFSPTVVEEWFSECG